MKSHFTIRRHLQPGDVGYLIYLHGVLYAKEHGFDHTFEAYVAAPLAEFIQSPDQERQRLWIAEVDENIVGAIAIVGVSEQKAQLRWLIVHPDSRGLGLGRTLVEKAIDFCRDRGYKSIILWTVSALTAAKRLYESVGFVKTEEETHKLWGTVVTEERYDLSL
jgi:ribosomal protein S18 acetylase RimI-like enzyme